MECHIASSASTTTPCMARGCAYKMEREHCRAWRRLYTHGRLALQPALTRRSIRSHEAARKGYRPDAVPQPSTADRWKRSAGGASWKDRPHRPGRSAATPMLRTGCRQPTPFSPFPIRPSRMCPKIFRPVSPQPHLTDTRRVKNQECKMAAKPTIGVNVDYRSSRRTRPRTVFFLPATAIRC